MNLDADSTIVLRHADKPDADFVSACVRHTISGPSGSQRITVELGIRKEFRKRRMVTLHADRDGIAWSVPCTVVRVSRGEDGDILDLQMLEEPTQVELRRADRVPTYAHGVTASLDGKPHCLVVDVSEHGFAVVTTQRYQVDQLLDIELSWKNRSWRGRAVISRVARADTREARLYGMAVRSEEFDEELEHGLGSIASTLRLQQLLVAH